MIAYIEGRLAHMWGTQCVVVTQGGVGYTLALPGHSLSRLPEKGGQVAFHTSLIVREDALEIYGFETWDERQTFEILVSISKVGARTALNILSVFGPDDLRRCVLEDDVLSLTRVSGIGKKTAQHIFLELKYKLKVEDAPALLSVGTTRTVMRDVLDGLANLGYEEQETVPVVQRVLHDEPDLDVSGALRAALKALAKGKS